jgi:hypothetical protein
VVLPEVLFSHFEDEKNSQDEKIETMLEKIKRAVDSSYGKDID